MSKDNFAVAVSRRWPVDTAQLLPMWADPPDNASEEWEDTLQGASLGYCAHLTLWTRPGAAVPSFSLPTDACVRLVEHLARALVEDYRACATGAEADTSNDRPPHITH
jgi:hypothetical protein